LKRKRVKNSECPVARALDVIGDWWTLLIVRDAFDGVRRFGDFQRSLNISKGILASRLKGLKEAGIVEHAPSTSGAHDEYTLTPKGRDLFLVIVSLRQWGEAHCFASGESHSVLVERATGRRVLTLRLPGRRSAELDDAKTTVRKAKST
jgi:DNA-binding HxlR family transcriptional regulator